MKTSYWKWFSYDEVFVIKKGERLTKADQIEGNIPYVSSKSTNNGIDGYIDNGYTDENCISFACYGCIGEVFYHSNKVWVSDNCNVLYLKNRDLNAPVAMFLISILYKEKYKFSYGMTAKKERLKTFKIKLPINKNGFPDWECIENYVNNLNSQLPQKTKSIWNNNFDKEAISDKNISFNAENWKWFRYDEIFNIKKGFYNKKPDEDLNGQIPFIGATDSNNGITSWHDYETIELTSKTGDEKNASIREKIFKPNCITVSNNGSVGFAFYQPQKFTCTHDVNPLYLKNKELNIYIAMFLCTLIEKEKYRWAYGRKWRPVRMPKSLIKLPVTTSNTPDWQFMEDYIKSLPYSKSI
jgi:hypothetical protein